MDGQGIVVESDKIVSVKNAFLQSGLSPELFLEMLAPANLVFLQSLGPARINNGKECYFCLEVHGTPESEIRLCNVDDFENSYGTVFIYKDDYDNYLKNKIEFFSLPIAPSSDEVSLLEASLLVNIPEDALLTVLNLGLMHTNLEKDHEQLIEDIGVFPPSFYNEENASVIRIDRKSLLEYAEKNHWIVNKDDSNGQDTGQSETYPEWNAPAVEIAPSPATAEETGENRDMEKKSASELLAMHEMDPDRWSLLELGKTFYDGEGDRNNPNTLRGWAKKQLKKAQRERADAGRK